MKKLPALLILLMLAALFPFPLKADVEKRNSEHGSYSFRFSRWRDDSSHLQLLPSGLALLQDIPEELRALDPTLSVEMLATIPLEAYVSKAKIEEQLTAMLNVLLNAEMLAGLTFINKQKNVERVLFQASSYIVSPENRASVPYTPIETRKAETRYLLQHALPFQPIVVQQTMEHHDTAFLVKSLLLSEMKYGIIDVVQEKDAITYVGISHHKAHIKLYCLYSIKVQPSVRIFAQQLENSVFSRMDALFSWIRTQLIDTIQ